MSRLLALGSLVVGICISCMDASAQEYTGKQLENFFAKVAGEYKFESEGLLSPEGLKLQEQPILKWTNPIRMQNKGSLFVWTDEGRPRVIASIFSFSFSTRVRYRHEIYSLLDRPMKATLNDRVVWQPEASDAKWRKIEGVQPSENAARRLVQMRTIARQFTGEVADKQDANQTQLKLLPQPLMRYRADKHSVIDGGIFGLAMATDPEAYLLIEAFASKANSSDEDPDGWRYTVIPSTYLSVSVSRNGSLVWKQERNMALESAYEGQLPLAAKPYFTFFSRDQIPPPDELN